MSFLDKMKKAGKSVVDAGAKQMLKVGVISISGERRIFSREFSLASLPNTSIGLAMRSARVWFPFRFWNYHYVMLSVAA
jgi:hypothetical protein